MKDSNEKNDEHEKASYVQKNSLKRDKYSSMALNENNKKQASDTSSISVIKQTQKVR